MVRRSIVSLMLVIVAACGSSVDQPIALQHDSGTALPPVDGSTDAGAADVADDSGPDPVIGEESLPCATPGTAMTKSRFIANNGTSATKFSVPKETNPYRCWVFQSPTTDSYVSDYAPILDNTSVVHHMILYAYLGKTPPFGGAAGPVDCKGMPSNVNLEWGWAPGGTNFAFPPDVTQKIPANTTLIVQIHYNNAHLADASDASGIAWCSGADRARHAGVFWTGKAGFVVPPHATNYEVAGDCPPKSWPVTSIPFDLEVIGAFPHMHTHGHKIWTEQFRGGALIDTMVRNDSWDFNAQGFVAMNPSKKILKGDKLVTHCTYDNAGDTPISFGENTENEMCFDFLYTIPDVNTLYAGADKCVAE